MDLTDFDVTVFGAGSGIGLAVAETAGEAGARVRAVSRTGDKLERAFAGRGVAAQTHAVDVTDTEALDALLEDVGELGHVVVCVGGDGAQGPFESYDEATLRRAFESKFWAYLKILWRVRDRLAANGSVTLVTGRAATKPMVGMSGLAAVNGALEGMVGPLALEWAPVRVNAVSPGLIDTPYWRKMPADAVERMYRSIAERSPAKRVGEPVDVARAVLAVLGNDFLTGIVLPCDGGLGVT